MVQRRRYATRAELVELLAERGIDPTAVRAVVDGLADLGAPVDALVKVVVDEPLLNGNR